MRVPAVLLLVLAFVVGVAMTGSRAQPVAGAISPGFRVCQPIGPRVLDGARCQPVVTVTAGIAEFDRAFDYGGYEAQGGLGGFGQHEAGGDYSPEWPAAATRVVRELVEIAVKAGLVAAVYEGMERAFDWAFGNGVEIATVAPDTLAIFDPVR